MTEREPPRQIGTDEPSPEALARFLADECSPDEAASVRQWMDLHPERAATLDAVRAATPALARTAPTVDVEAALAAVHARMAHEDRARPMRQMRWTTAIGLAAAAALAIVWVASTWQGPVADWWENLTNPRAKSGITEATAADTETIHLADGSTVLLGPHSALTYRGDFGERHRAVTLEGFGRFTVRHDASKPFVVTDGAAVIEDLGTTFAVRDGDDSAVVVAVTSGEVRLTRADNGRGSVELRAGERGVAHPHARPERDEQGVVAADTSWTNGRLTFNDTPLAAAAPEIERWYGVHIRIADSTLAARRLTATFEATDPVDRVLSTISLALGVEFNHVMDSVVISRAPSP